MSAPTNTIFESEPMVHIPKREYEKLLEYKAICKDIYAKFGGEINEH